MPIYADARGCGRALSFWRSIALCLFLLLAPFIAQASNAKVEHLHVAGKWLSLAASLDSHTRGVALTANADHWLVIEFPSGRCDSPVVSVVEMEGRALDEGARGAAYVRARVDVNPALNGIALLRAMKGNRLFVYLAFEEKPTEGRLIAQMSHGRRIQFVFYAPFAFARPFRMTFSLQGAGKAISHARVLCEGSGLVPMGSRYFTLPFGRSAGFSGDD